MARMLLILALMLSALDAHAAEILVKAVSHTHADPDKDQRGAYKAGMPVVVMPDGHQWGREEGLPKFVVIKIPGVPVESVQKYIDSQSPDGRLIVRRRRWLLRIAALPAAARNKLETAGALTIRAGDYKGPADYTWNQVRQYMRNQETGLDETGGL